MTPIALPQGIVRALRDRMPDAKDFTPTKFQPAASKAWFVGHCVKFISADFPRHQFTRRFYGQMIHCFGFIAMYDENGFWTEYFTTNAGKIEFLQQMLSHPCYGDSCHTFSDAEREIIKRLRQTNVLGFYKQRLGIEQDAADRAELARLVPLHRGFDGLRWAALILHQSPWTRRCRGKREPAWPGPFGW